MVYGPPVALTAMSQIAFPKLAGSVPWPIICWHRTPSLQIRLAELRVRKEYIGARCLSTCAALGRAGPQVVADEKGSLIRI